MDSPATNSRRSKPGGIRPFRAKGGGQRRVFTSFSRPANEAEAGEVTSTIAREIHMLLELNILPLGRGRSISSDIADVVKIIDASGLDYKLTAEGTIL